MSVRLSVCLSHLFLMSVPLTRSAYTADLLSEGRSVYLFTYVLKTFQRHVDFTVVTDRSTAVPVCLKCSWKINQRQYNGNIVLNSVGTGRVVAIEL